MPRTASPGKPESHDMDKSVMKFNLVSTAGPRKSQNQVDVSIKGYGITPADRESPDMEKMIRKLTKNVIKIQKQIQKEHLICSEKSNPDVVAGASKAKRKKKRKPISNDTMEDIPKIQVVQQMGKSNDNIFTARSKSSHKIEHSSSCSNNKLNARNKSISTCGSSNRCMCSHNDAATNAACSCSKLSATGLLTGKVASCDCKSMASSRSKSQSTSIYAMANSRSKSQSTSIYAMENSRSKSQSTCMCTHNDEATNEVCSCSKLSATDLLTGKVASCNCKSTSTPIMPTKDVMTSLASFAQPFSIEHDVSNPLSVSQASSSCTQKKRKSNKNKSSSIECVPYPSSEVTPYEKHDLDGSKQSLKLREISKDKLHSHQSSTKSSTKSKHKTCPESSKSVNKNLTTISGRKVSEENILKSAACDCGKDPTVSRTKQSYGEASTACGKDPTVSRTKQSYEEASTACAKELDVSRTKQSCEKDLGVSRSSQHSSGKATSAGPSSDSICEKSSSAGHVSRHSTSNSGKTSSNESMTELDRKTRFLEQFLLCGRSEHADCSGSTSTVSNVKSDGKSKYLDQYFNCNCDDTTKLDRKSKMVEELLTCVCKSDVKNTFSDTKGTYLKGYLDCNCRQGLGPSEIQKKMKIIENSLQCNRVESTFLMDDIDKKNTYLNKYLKCDCNNEHDIDHKGKFIERVLTCECDHEHDPDIDSKKKFLNKHVKCDCGSSCPKPAVIKEAILSKNPKVDSPKPLTPKTSEKIVSKMPLERIFEREVPVSLTRKTSESNVSKTPSERIIKRKVPVSLGQPRVCGDNIKSGKATLKMPLTKPGWADGKVLLCSCGEGEVSECRCQEMCDNATPIKQSTSKRKHSATKARKTGEKPAHKVYSAHTSAEKVDAFQSSENGGGLVCGCGKTNNAQCICDSLMYSTGSRTKTIAYPVLSTTKTLGSEPTIMIDVKQKTENGDVHMKLVGHRNDQQHFNGRIEVTKMTGGPLKKVYPPLSPVKLSPDKFSPVTWSSVTLPPVNSGPRLNLKNITLIKCPISAVSASNSIEALKAYSTEVAYRSSFISTSSNPLVTQPMYLKRTSSSPLATQLMSLKRTSSSPLATQLMSLKRTSSSPLATQPIHTDNSIPCCHRPKSSVVSSSSQDGGSTSISCPHLALSISNSDDYECYVCAKSKSRTSKIKKSTVMVVTMDEKKTPFRHSEKKKMKSRLLPSIFLNIFKGKKSKITAEKKSQVTFQKSEISCNSLYRFDA